MTDANPNPSTTTTPADPSQTLLSLHFLHRLGLTCDELHWPSTTIDAATPSIAVDTIPETWRIRDVISNILSQNGVRPDFIEYDATKGKVMAISYVLDNVSPSEMEVDQFRMMYDSEEESDVDDSSMESEEVLNISCVYKAFSAAAYSILRSRNYAVKASSVGSAGAGLKKQYEPPLVRAIESIRTERMDSLNEASGKSVAPFLKKNNTIPWFHVPIVEQKNYSKDIMAVAKVKRHTIVKPSAPDTKMVEAKEEKKSVKRPVSEVVKEHSPEKRIKLDNKPVPSSPTSKKVKPEPIQSSATKKPPPLRLENRPNLSRAMLCSAAATVFQSTTPDFSSTTTTDAKEWVIDPTAMPHHLEAITKQSKKKSLEISPSTIIHHATALGKDVTHQLIGCAKRYDMRYKFKLASRRILCGGVSVGLGQSLPLVLPNPFGVDNMAASGYGGGYGGTDSEGDEDNLTAGPIKRQQNEEWTGMCMPRLLSILNTGAGHVILHDVEWRDRAFRVADLLRGMATSSRENYGPHLIVTAAQDVGSFGRVFAQMGHDLRVVRSHDETLENATLRVLKYHGTKEKRRRLRKHFGSLSPSPDSPYCFLGGQPDSPYHVVLTTYSEFAEDYTHFCQIPFQAVILDDGMSWLGCAHADPSSKLGKVWEMGLWSRLDHGAGLAGVSNGVSTWDFGRDDGGIGADSKTKGKSAFARRDSTSGASAEKSNRSALLIGLTARHRILLASNMHAACNGQVYRAPVTSLLSFLVPHFMETVRDDWDKSKMIHCERSMSYLRKLVARSIVVYSGKPNVSSHPDLFALAVKSLNGELTHSPHQDDGTKKYATLQRKDALAWFRPGSAMLTELNDVTLDSILSSVKSFNSMGFVCEEIVPASTLTASGSNGAITGPAAYRTAVRCGKPFSNEQSLKQHIAAYHAPKGTWLCKTCGVDCVTSQAKSHHEKSCIPEGNTEEMIVSAALTAIPQSDNRRGPKKKEIKGLAAATVKKDNSSLVKGFYGVYVRPDGKHFIKVDGKVVPNQDQNQTQKDMPLLFDSAEEAAKAHDQNLKDSGKAEVSKMNFKPDGSRIIHEQETTKKSANDDTAQSEGGAGPNVIVPALSVVNIKNLPKDVKPLLRDPNQTSRTGGNSKRYVYAYRGVCRQARKGHDRWQAQISFNGFNHYLGTFDSEWDAAAVYAWAHLILYGEEATKKAQKEGEEAAARYEQLQKDIAEGKVPANAPTPPKKKKKPPGAPKGPRGPRGPRKPASDLKIEIKQDKMAVSTEDKADKLHQSLYPQLPPSITNPGMVERESSYTSLYIKKDIPKTVTEWNKLKTTCAQMLSSGTKGTSKANLLASKKNLACMSNSNLLENISERSTAGSTSFLKSIISFGQSFKSLPTCIALTSYAPASIPGNSALLIGLSAAKFSWDLEDFLSKCHNAGARYAVEYAGRLMKEYGRAGSNASFRSLLLSTPCIIGRASEESQKPYKSVGIKNTVGMSVGRVGCDIGGPENSCSESAARIDLVPTQHSKFQFLACNDEDIVTLNGKRIQSSMGPFPLKNHDICSVGARVFVFIEAYSAKRETGTDSDI